MLATSLRTRPCNERSCCVSPGRFTSICESLISRTKPGGSLSSSLPLGPSTLSRPPASCAFTPFSRVTGNLPMRDISPFPLPNPQQNLAADLFAPRLAIGHHAERCRHHLHPHPMRHARHRVRSRVTPQARTAHAFDSADNRLAFARVAQAHEQLLAGNFAGDFDAAQKALGRQGAANRLAHARMRNFDLVVTRMHGVATPGQQFSDGIGLRHYASLIFLSVDSCCSSYPVARLAR